MARPLETSAHRLLRHRHHLPHLRHRHLTVILPRIHAPWARLARLAPPEHPQHAYAHALRHQEAAPKDAPKPASSGGGGGFKFGFGSKKTLETGGGGGGGGGGSRHNSAIEAVLALLVAPFVRQGATKEARAGITRAMVRLLRSMKRPSLEKHSVRRHGVA